MSTSSLGFRLGSTLVLAILPLGVLSIIQAQNAQRELTDSTLDGIAGSSLRAAQTQIELIKDAQITARTFAAALSDGGFDPAGCAARAMAVARTIPEASLVAYTPMSGHMTCSSTGKIHDFGDNPLFQKMIAKPEPSVVYNPMGPVSETAVVGVGYPVLDRAGVQIGITSISLPYRAITPDTYVDRVALWRPEYLATVSGDGTLLISSMPERNFVDELPAGVEVKDLPGRAGRATFEADDRGRHILSVTPVADGLFFVSIWQREASGLFDPASVWSPYLMPALTWVAALVAAAFAAGRLVVRHVRALSRSMRDYLKDRTRVKVPDITNAPAEIQQLHSSYEQLVRTIEQEEAELQNLIMDKDTLLREVNHRSGNSLQIIASVMRMYRREARDPGLQAVLDGLVNRVMALSTTHTSLYALSGQRDVPLDEVLFNVVRRLKEIHRISIGTADKRFDPIRTDAQTATRVALAAAEALGCFFAVPALATGQVRVFLTCHQTTIRLHIEGPSVPEFQPGATQGIVSLPMRMLQQFAVQLNGTLKVEAEETGASVDLEFPKPSAAAHPQLS